MKSKQFAAALWADDWETILREGDGCVQGVVAFDEDEGVRLDLPFGEVLKDAGVLVFGGEGLPDGLEWLYGFSQDGYWIALSDAYSLGTGRSFPGGPRQTVGAAQMLFSKDKFDPRDAIIAVTLELSGLAEWLGKSPIKSGRRQVDGTARSFFVDVELDDDCDEALHDSEDVSISVCHGVTLSGSAELGVEIGHKCMIKICFKRARSLADAQAVAFRVADFFSFCFGFSAEISRMSLGFEGGAEATCLAPLVKGSAPSRIIAQRMVLPYWEVCGSLNSMLRVWLADEDDLRVPSSLLVSLLTKRWLLPADLKFIAAAQMLEALCRVGADLRSMGEEEFEVFRGAVMVALDGIEDRRISRMAKERIRPGNSKGQRRLLSEFVERHRVAAEYVFGDPKAFVGRHAYLRNGVTHRNGEADADAIDLVWHTEGVLLLAYCATGELLGLPAETMTRRLKDSGFKSAAVRKCRKMYSPKLSEADGPG